MSANTWPLPAGTPNTNVDTSDGKKTVGYPATMKKFVGRALDVHETKMWQNNPMRTLTAYRICAAPSRNRLFALLGSTVMSYDATQFFARLAAHEPLVSLWRPDGFGERYLQPDRGQFYAEAEPTWITPVTDGQNRLFDLAFDDRGYLYVAYSTFGWGALKVNEGGLESAFQIPADDGAGDPITFNVLSVKSGGDYYVIASPESGPSALYYVGNAAGIVHERRPNVNVRVMASAKAQNGSRIGILDPGGFVRFYTDQSILSGTPIDEHGWQVWPSGMLPSGIASDGTNFYVIVSGGGNPAILAVFEPDGATYRRSIKILASTMQRPGIDWGAGYLTVYGIDGVGRNLHLFKTPTLEEVPLNNFFCRYYHLAGDPAFATPLASGLDTSSAPGAHAVVLTSGNKAILNVMAGGLWDTFELTPGVDIIASFIYSPLSPQPGTAVSFEDKSFGPVSTRLWDFGDNTTSTATNPQHTFALPGRFEVKLTVSGGGKSDTATQTVVVPELEISVTPGSSAKTADVLTFAAVGQLNGQEVFDWNFGDGSAHSSSPQPTHAYPNVGDYTVVLRCTSSAGTRTATKGVHIRFRIKDVNLSNTGIIVAPSNTGIPVGVNSSVNVNTFLTFRMETFGWIPNGGELYDWDFGDQTAHSVVPVPAHAYATPGFFTVTLRVSGTAVGSVTRTVRVATIDVVAIVVEPDNATARKGDSFLFRASGQMSGQESYDWDFGDNTQHSSVSSPMHKYDNPGDFNVVLRLTTSTGTRMAEKAIHIGPPVVVTNANTAISVEPMTGAKAGDSIRFSMQPTWRLNGGEIYDWDFGDGTPHSPLPAPTHVYAGGNFTPTLTLTGSAIGSVSQAIHIEPPPGPVTAAILTVVGSVQGAGAFFRTGLQAHNPGTATVSGKFVFHRQGTTGTPTDPSLSYNLAPGETVDHADLLPAMGLSGLGSLDIVTQDRLPLMVARIFSDKGDAGTSGFTIEPVPPSAALQAGDNAVLIAPSDPAKTTFNIGVRSLDAGALLSITVRRKNGTAKGAAVTKTYTQNFFEQVRSDFFLGMPLEGSDSINFSVSSGAAIVYGASTDNQTQDPSFQSAKRI